MMKKIKKAVKGFTLIELLVVIAIIGILAVAFLPSVMGAPQKARDAARLAAIQTISEKFATKDLNGTPLTFTAGGQCLAGASTSVVAGGFVVVDFENGFPADPSGTTGTDGLFTDCKGYIVMAATNGARYFAAAKMEDTTKGNFDCPPAGAMPLVGAVDVDTVDFTTGGTCYGVLLK